MEAPNQIPCSPFQSILNFRDVALATPLLKPHMLHRSARPDQASYLDRQTLVSSYGIRTIVDLRSKTEQIERAQKQNKQGHSEPVLEAQQISSIAYVGVDLNGGAFSRALLWKLGWGSLLKLMSLMAAGYRTEAISILGREVMAPRGLIGLAKDVSQSLEQPSLELVKKAKMLHFAYSMSLIRAHWPQILNEKNVS